MEKLLRKGLSKIEGYSADTADRTIEQLQAMFGLAEVEKLSFNENPYGPSPLAIEAMQKIVPKLHIYPDHEYIDLRTTLAQYYHLTPAQVILGNGADELITMVTRTFLNEGDEVIIPTPTFGQYAVNVKLMNATPILVPCKNFNVDLDAILQQINPQTKMIFICNPNNPTGRIITKQEFDLFVNKLPAHVILVVDEAYFEYADNPDIANGIDYVKMNNNIIVIRTFSKFYGLAGARVGYALSTPELIKNINRTRMPVNVNYVGMEGAMASLKDTEHAAKIKKLTTQEKQYLYKEFSQMGFSYLPSETCFIFVNFEQDTNRLFAELAKEGIIIRPGACYGFPTYARISLGNHLQNRKLVNALKRILAQHNYPQDNTSKSPVD